MGKRKHKWRRRQKGVSYVYQSGCVTKPTIYVSYVESLIEHMRFSYITKTDIIKIVDTINADINSSFKIKDVIMRIEEVEQIKIRNSRLPMVIS
jgi:hypothetical protein